MLSLYMRIKADEENLSKSEIFMDSSKLKRNLMDGVWIKLIDKSDIC